MDQHPVGGAVRPEGLYIPQKSPHFYFGARRDPYKRSQVAILAQRWTPLAPPGGRQGT